MSKYYAHRGKFDRKTENRKDRGFHLHTAPYNISCTVRTYFTETIVIIGPDECTTNIVIQPIL